MNKVSLRMAIGFGDLYKSEAELMEKCGFNREELAAEISKMAASLTVKKENGVNFYAMTARIVK